MSPFRPDADDLHRPAWVEVDLDSIGRNFERIRSTVEPAGVLAVVKADAYGHGAVQVSRALEQAHVDWLGVALVEEGIELRRGGVTPPILVLGPAQPGHVGAFVENDLVPAISSLQQLDFWLSAARSLALARPLEIHLKFETGMHRLGIPRDEWEEALSRVKVSPCVRLGGVASHLAHSETPNSELNEEQETLFRVATILARQQLPEVDFAIHLASSAAALHRPQSRHSIVRAGLALFGMDPTRRLQEFEPAMSVRGRLVHRMKVATGERIGYGGEWTASRPSLLGIVQVGYADGYAWRLGNRAEVLVGGRRAPVAGAVSMDMLAVDLTDIDANTDATVTLLGASGNEAITAWELAQRAGISHYELLCHFGLRLPKVYLRDGLKVGASSRFR